MNLLITPQTYLPFKQQDHGGGILEPPGTNLKPNGNQPIYLWLSAPKTELLR